MSILPLNKLGSAAADSSSFNISPSQDFNHGFLPSQQHQQQQPHHSPPISNSASFAEQSPNPTNPSGSLAMPADHDGPAKLNGQEKQPDQNSAPSNIWHHEIGNQAGFESSLRQGKSSVTPNANQVSAPAASHGASTSSSGRKSQMVSGNHLLNFHYDPISRSQSRDWLPHPRRQHRRKPYNKDLFLQANYKFVMLDSGNHVPESMDPDTMLQWEDIICLKYYTPGQVQCPICLDYPLCPQITPCGHIYCFPCILQYLMLGGDDHKAEYSRKCPLCFMMISSKDMFTIYIENVKEYHVGDAIEFWLLTRQKESFVLSLKNNKGINSIDEVQDSFSKLTFTSDVNMSVREAMSDLDSWLARADSGLVDDLEKLPYVCAAIKLLEQRKKYWRERQLSSSQMTSGCSSSLTTLSGTHNTTKASDIGVYACKSVSNSPFDDQSAWFQYSAQDQSTNWMEASGVPKSLDDHDGVPSSIEDNGKTHQTQVDCCSDGKTRDSYDFYQAVDGQNLILHPLNMKCLLHHYGDYDRLPNRITGKILQLESVTQSEAMRKRYRYLSHFSLTATFLFCEIDLTETLPADALSPFMDEISNREKQRKRLARKEHRNKIKAEAAGLHFMPVTANLERNSYDESPTTFSLNDFEALGSSTSTSSSPPNIGERQSFSNVARLGFAAGHDSPALKTEDTESQLRVNLSHDSSSPSGARSSSSSGPSFASVASRGKPPERPEVAEANKIPGKKGKKPSRVLMSTSGGRRY